MSGVGAVLVQPQRLRRASSASPVGGLLEDIRIVAARMGADGLAGGHMADLIGAAFDDAAQRMIDRATGAAGAQARLLALAAPLVDGLRAQITALTAATGPDDVVEGLQDLVDSITKAAAGLEAQSVRSFVEEVLDILETDLRLTPAAVLGDLDALFDDVLERLQDVAAEPDPAARKRRLDTARALRRIRRRLEGIEVPLPELDATRIGDDIVEFLNRYGLETRAAQVACVGRNVGSGFRVGTRVLEVVPFTGFAAGSIGAAANGVSEDRLCWYATWLMKGKRRAWYQSLFLGREEEVWVDAAADRIVLRTPGEDDIVLAAGTTDWTQASIFKASTPLETLGQLGLEAHYTIGDPVGADALEKTAYWTAVLGKALEMVLHLISLEPGDYASNTLHAAASFATAIFELVQDAPFPWWFDFLTWLASLFTTLEGIHTNATAWNCFTLWITLAGPDVIEAYIYRAVVGTIRDFILSLLTLVNHEPPTAGGVRPQNRKEVDGVAEVGSILMNKLLMFAVPEEDYTIPGMGGTGHALRLLLGWNLLGGAIAGAMGGFLGALLAKGFADTDDWSEFGRKIGFSMLKTGLLFFPSLNMDKEGKTKDGTYNPYPSPNNTPFIGYPAAASSPYNLPYEAGRLEYVDQANQGLFSHNFLNHGQVYGYDFALDEGVEILACRPGTVVDWGDQTDDNTTGNWNFIIIKHDVTDARTASVPDGVHDLGPAGNPVLTYAVYGHGRKNSVRELFAARGVTVAQLNAGTVKVARGQPIMRSGDTGMSFHNHLHLHVVPDNGSGGRADFTIPFVFQEVSRLMDTDGVCTRFNFYRSTNTKV